jgi:phenylalanyl-tRNA synthetase beta chain
VFEIGRVFTPAQIEGDLPNQPVTLGILLGHKSQKDEGITSLFSSMKGLIHGLSKAVGRAGPTLRQGSVTAPFAHPIRQAQIFAGETCVGYIADISPVTLHALNIQHTTALLEIDLDKWRCQPEQECRYEALAKFPSVFRDLAVVVNENIQAGQVQDAIQGVDNLLIRDVAFQSVFRSDDLGQDKKCLAWSITVRHNERTLKDSLDHQSRRRSAYLITRSGQLCQTGPRA